MFNCTLIRQLSDEDKMKLSRELKAETRKLKLQHLLEVFLSRTSYLIIHLINSLLYT